MHKKKQLHKREYCKKIRGKRQVFFFAKGTVIFLFLNGNNTVIIECYFNGCTFINFFLLAAAKIRRKRGWGGAK